MSYGLVQGPLPMKSGVDYNGFSGVGDLRSADQRTFLPKITAPAALRIATHAASSDGWPPPGFLE